MFYMGAFEIIYKKWASVMQINDISGHVIGWNSHKHPESA